MPQTGARIRKINVEVGDYVVKGQVLAEMDRLQLDQLELQIQNDEIEYARLKGLYEEGGVSQSDFEAAELGYKVRKTNYQNLLENTILRSPITGFVTARNFDKGDMFSMSAPLFTVQQVIPVKLLVGISENEYTKVKKGDTVSLTVDALPGRTFTGKVNRLYPTINAATHTFNAEVLVQNSDRALRPGMFARVKVVFGTNHRVVLPDQCIVKQEGTGQKFVYLLNTDETVSYVPVTLGRHMGTEYEVIDGVLEGDTVVFKGQSTLKDGVKVIVLE
jgi:RND family efflux transporter MFP subunit